MAIPLKKRVKAHRDKLRASGLRPIQIWVPDIRNPNFAAECQRQCLVIAKDINAEKEILDWVDENRDTEGWVW